MHVVIVGAGLAGLATARTLAEAGLAADVLEATERVGGRARTHYDGHAALPVELGPEFVHGTPDSTAAIARDAGLPIYDGSEMHHLRRDGRLVEAGDLWQRFGELLAGAADATVDESARAYLARRQLAPEDRQLFALFVEGFYGAPLDDISIRSIAADASGAGGDDTGGQARVYGGYGRLVAWLATRALRGGARIHPGCCVHAIDWSGERVRLDVKHREPVLADRVVVTLPVGVLPSIRFVPTLGDHTRALARFAMGQVVKLVACFREPVWHPPSSAELAFLHGNERGGFPTFWLRSSECGVQQLTAWAGGPHARALARCSGHELLERALDGFATTVGATRGQLAAALRDHHFHDYQADPFARGAYSYTRVGGEGAAATLARPIADRVFFAGEATDAAYEGTVAGALASGARAACEVIASFAGNDHASSGGWTRRNARHSSRS